MKSFFHKAQTTSHGYASRSDETGFQTLVSLTLNSELSATALQKAPADGLMCHAQMSVTQTLGVLSLEGRQPCLSRHADTKHFLHAN